MNRCHFSAIAFLLLPPWAGAQPTVPPVAPAAEDICGYRVRYASVMAGQVERGLSVELLAGPIVAGRPATLRFLVEEKPRSTPADDLQINHDKFMHVIGVRDDLGGFFHLHPQKTAEGLWQVPQTFTSGGRYQIWCDVKQRGTVYSFRQPPLLVAGKINPAPSAPVPKFQETNSGFHLELTGAGNLIAGKTNQFQVTIHDGSGNQIATEFYLGSLLHLIIIKDDLSVYLHGHAQNHDRTDLPIRFQQVFPRPGNYKLFAQFRPHETTLPSEEAILAEFWVKVKAAE